MQDESERYTKENEKAAQHDADRLQNAIAGRETGAVQTALPAENAPDARDKKERDERDRLAQHVEAILSDQERYDKLFNETMDLLEKAEIVADQAITVLKNRLELHEAQFAQKLKEANRLSDGTLVFKDANDNVVDKNGERITDQAEIDGIIWRDGAMNYHEYTSDIAKGDRLKEALGEAETYRTETLGDARERLTDDENKPDYEEVEEIRDLILDNAPEGTNLDYSASSEKLSISNPVSPDIAIPDIRI